jgi:uncharacterized C2H2 Zn-finger protein
MLVEDSNDSRQEWVETYYHCPECDAEYTRRTEYKTQSHLVESDILYDAEGNEVK